MDKHIFEFFLWTNIFFYKKIEKKEKEFMDVQTGPKLYIKIANHSYSN